MNIKGFWNGNVGFVLKNLLVAVVLGCVIVIALLFWLKGFTRHGHEVLVPDVKGMYVEEAEIMARNAGMRVQVIDSTYSRTVELGTVVEQKPMPGARSKTESCIYLVVNAKSKRMVPVPELRDLSSRQAEATLQALGLGVEDMQYEPSQYKDLVLDVRRGGQSLEPGTRLEEGAKVVLVVGFGQGTEQVRIPLVIGQSKEAARATLLASRLILGSLQYDEELTDENASLFVVYQQTPSEGETILEGSRVDIRLTTSLEKAATAERQQSEEDFF